MADKKESTTVTIRARTIFRVVFAFLTLYICYLFVAAIQQRGFSWQFMTSEDFLIPVAGIICLSFITFTVFIVNILIGPTGVAWVIGFVDAEGIAHGKKRDMKWDYVQIRVYDFFFMPAIAFDTSRVPYIWSLFMTNFNDAAWMLLKYASRRAVSMEDKEVLAKYARKSKLPNS